MTAFSMPALGEVELNRIRELSILGNSELTEAQAAEVRGLLTLEGGAIHASVRQPIQMAERHGFILARAGIHLRPEGGDPETPAGSVHYITELRRSSSVQQPSDDGWPQVAEVVSHLLGPHPATVRMRLEVPRGTNLAVQLPIDLAAAEVIGFSKIAGVRLIQSAPDDPDLELYSAIVDLYSDGIQVSLRSIATISFGDTMLMTALEHLRHIADLALPEE